MYVNFSRVARIELKEAVRYYNGQSEGLGFDFANEIKLTLDRIIDYPDSWPKLSKNTRRARASRFPYGIIYSNTGNEILIIAIMNLHQKPDYWKNHLKSD